MVHKLGSGGIATVWLVWDQVDHRYFALKIMRVDQLELSKEVQVHQYLARLNIDLEENFICPLYDNFLHQGPNGTHICVLSCLWQETVSQSTSTGLFLILRIKKLNKLVTMDVN